MISTRRANCSAAAEAGEDIRQKYQKGQAAASMALRHNVRLRHRRGGQRRAGDRPRLQQIAAPAAKCPGNSADSEPPPPATRARETGARVANDEDVRDQPFETVARIRTDMRPVGRPDTVEPAAARGEDAGVSNWTRACECLDLERWAPQEPRKVA